MPTTNYITLTPSSGSGYRFKAIEMAMPHRRTDSIDYTIGGKIDKHSGPIIKSWVYTLRIPIDIQTDPVYGCYDNLMYLFDLTSSSGSVTDVITLLDHFGQSHFVYFSGEMSPKPLTTQLEGVNAWHIVPVTLLEIP
jgi:hypothetical protein